MADAYPNVHGARRIEQHALLGELASGAQVSFAFDGTTLSGRDGEPLLAALLANGVRVTRTMPHTDEPRGGYCLTGRCADCMVIVDGSPSIRACETPLVAGMLVETQHGLGHWSLEPR